MVREGVSVWGDDAYALLAADSPSARVFEA